MKNIFTLIIFSLVNFYSSSSLTAQVNNSSQWTWINGSATSQPAVYGTKGVPDANNTPGSRYQSVNWTDASGNFWLYSGGSGAADLWKYNPSTKLWTWVQGSSTSQPTVYGTKGVADVNNTPGTRTGGIGWVDASGNLWLYGGSDADDLWKYNIATNMWTWVKGFKTADPSGYVGTDDVKNTPGSRYNSVSWSDASGNFWLYGGIGTFWISGYADLWKYDPVTDLWSMIKGSYGPVTTPGSYGTKGVAATGNGPGSRLRSVSWVDPSGSIYLFGGQYFDGKIRYLNDLWKYDPSTNLWTWLSGSNTLDQAGIYGTKGVAAPANTPGARSGMVGWTDASGNLWLFGGGRIENTQTSLPNAHYNDLWKYEKGGNQWTWVSGSDTAYQPGSYGTKGVPAASNTPGARQLSSSWKDQSGNFWLYGGQAYSIENDLWKFGGNGNSSIGLLSPPIFPTGGTSGPTSKLLVVNGNPAIVYYEAGDLKYVRSADTYGTAWGTPVTIEAAGDIGQSFSIQIVNGNPAVSYYDATNADLKYVRALDASGATWGTPITVDAVGTVGGTNSLQVVNGNPAIAYFDATSKGLKYVRALDASGTAWASPVTIEAGRVSATGDLQIVNGNPAINYVYPILKDNFNISTIDSSYLKYVRATDVSGTAWGTPVRIDASFNYNLGVGSFRVVNGNPAVAYDREGDNTPLKYSRATDALGTSWGTPITITTNAYSAIQPSLQIINGTPAIAYYDYYYRTDAPDHNNLAYVSSADASGTSWGTSVTLDSTGIVGRNPSLQEVMGSPAVSYYDFTNNKIKYLGPQAPALTTTTITSSTNPSTVGQAVTFTATVSATSGTPTGTVSFYEGTTLLGTGTLSGNTATFATSTLTTGSHNITAFYDGNSSYATSTSSVLTQVVNPAPPATTTTTIKSSTNPSTVGQAVTFTATVSTASGTPTGTVSFYDGTTLLGTGTLSGNTATFSTSSLTAGSHNITAVYSGNSSYAISTSSVLTQVVNPAPPATTTTTVTSSTNPSTVGQTVTFTATVSAASGTPTGTVSFYDGTTLLGTGTLSGNTATFSTSSLTAGSHNITAVYGGNSSYATSTSSVLTQVVNPAPPAITTTTITSSTNPSTVGQTVTFTATVSTASGTPTGTISFYDGTTLLGTGTLSGNTATFTTSTLTTGSHNITAVYGGNSSYATSTSSVLTQVVNPAPPSTTTITVSSSTNPSTVGQAVTFTATVSAASGTPSGTVSFYDGTTLLGTGTLSGNTATFSTSSLTAGSHNITAVYSGNSSYAISTSSVLTQKVLLVFDSPHLNIFPNPVTNSTIYLEMINMQAGNYNIKVIDCIGQILMVKQINHPLGSSTETLQLNKKISKGVYEIEIVGSDNNILTHKVIVN